MLVVVSLGSNIDRQRNLRFALTELNSRFQGLEVSPVYETAAVGFSGHNFFNLVAGFRTGLDFPPLRTALKAIEQQAGRELQRPKTCGNRVLDIDILLFGERILQPQFDVPRADIEKFAYVLKPLADLYPDTRHPQTGQRFATMWRCFAKTTQTITPVAGGLSPFQASA